MMLDIKMSPELEEFYNKHNIPEPLRKEAELMAQKIIIVGRRTAKETLELAAYIYWTHAKFKAHKEKEGEQLQILPFW